MICAENLFNKRVLSLQVSQRSQARAWEAFLQRHPLDSLSFKAQIIFSTYQSLLIFRFQIHKQHV